MVFLQQGDTGAAYGYNASGIRVSKQVGETYTYYLLDGGDVVAEFTDDALSAHYVRGINLIRGKFGSTTRYYLRARYYDPAIGRFTQQDPHWSPANMIYGDNPRKIYEGQDALKLSTYTYAPEISAIMQSGNLYVYCVGNPIMYSDPNGQWTVALGIDGAIAFGLGLTGTLQIIIDDNGNVGVLIYLSLQAGTPNASYAGILSISGADTIYDCEGGSYSAGGSFGVLIAGGAEVSYATSPLTGADVVTVSLSLGGGPIPAELHANFWGGTKVIWSTDASWVYRAAYRYIKKQINQLPLSVRDEILDIVLSLGIE